MLKINRDANRKATDHWDELQVVHDALVKTRDDCEKVPSKRLGVRIFHEGNEMMWDSLVLPKTIIAELQTWLVARLKEEIHATRVTQERIWTAEVKDLHAKNGTK
jgi:hypothetical protein